MFDWLRKYSRSDIAASAPYASALHRQGAQANQEGRHREAANLLIGALATDPGVAESHYELGRAMRGLGEAARAVTCYRKAIEIDPRHADAHIDLASAMLALGDPQAAEQSARKALAMAPGSIAATVNLGAALEGRGEFTAAADSYRAALAIDANCLPALANLGALCLRLGLLDEALRHAQNAAGLAPEDADARLRLGNVFLDLRRPVQATECFREALRLRPDDPAACNALGFTDDLQGRLDNALDFYERALVLDPDNVAAHLNRAGIRLVREDYAHGWEEYEWRQRSREYAPLFERFERFNVPRWDGSPLAGRRVLVYGEQGLGDEILFASCLPEVVAQAAHCVIDCEPRLAGLLRRAFPQATVHGGRQTDPVDWLAGAGPVDVRIPAGSLPLHLRRTAASFPKNPGFLRADPERTAAWRDRLQRLGPGRKIGISWRGGVPQTGRGSRTMALAELLPVLRTPGAIFVNLQYGPRSEELAALEKQHGIAIHHWQEAIDDYDDTAALVSALDLTLSVCTAVVDLAGALGRPVWVMAPVRSDFRYGLKGTTMPWYPSVRMFRQERYGEWDPVIASAVAALKETAG